MLPRLRDVALSALSLALVPALTAGAAPAASAARAASADDALTQVHTSGSYVLPNGLYRLVGTGYASQYGVTADGAVVSATDGSGYFGADAPSSLVGDDLVQLDAGYRHALALDRSGHVTTWGYLGEPDDNDPTASPRATVPSDIAAMRLTQVAAGGDHDLAITDAGTLVGWGSNENGTLNIPSGLTNVAEVDTEAYSAAVRLADGTVRSWGNPGSTPTQYATRSFTDIATSINGVIGLTADGDVVGWGFDGVGNVPAQVNEGTVVAIAAGSTAAAVLSDGSVVQWGGLNGEIDSPSVPAGTTTVGLQWGRYAAAVISAPTAPSRAPTIEEAPAPHDGLAELTADPGLWPAMTSPSFRYAWSLDGEPVGDDSPHLTVPWSDLGGKVRVVVTASDGSLYGRSRSTPLNLRVGRARFDLDAPASVRRGGPVRVEATGLAPNEPFVVVVGGASVARGTANRRGVASVRGTVPKRVGLGRQRLVLVGATEERFGGTAVDVERGRS